MNLMSGWVKYLNGARVIFKKIVQDYFNSLSNDKALYWKKTILKQIRRTHQVILLYKLCNVKIKSSNKFPL